LIGFVLLPRIIHIHIYTESVSETGWRPRRQVAHAYITAKRL